MNKRKIINRDKNYYNFLLKIPVLKQVYLPVPVAACSKAWACGRSPAEIVGSTLTRGMYVCLL
jgi:hypothetical protein